MVNFKEMLNRICDRPGLYVGECSLRLVSAYLSGYCNGVEDAEVPERPLDGWFRWVESKFLISHPAWHWTRILIHSYGSDETALQALPDLYEEFLQARAQFGVDAIAQERKIRLIAQYGRDVYAPIETTTKDPD